MVGLMPRITLPSNPKLCPHRAKHATWRAADGNRGVCMMAPGHIDRCIKMLLKSLKVYYTIPYILFDDENEELWDDLEPLVIELWRAEQWVEIFVAERNRRIKEGKWKSVT